MSLFQYQIKYYFAQQNCSNKKAFRGDLVKGVSFS